MMSRALASSRVLVNDIICPATIIFSIESGKILHIEKKVLSESDPLLILYNVLLHDYRIVSPLVIMPGLVDTHVHLNEPGRTEWEGFATGTKAAASGGVTTIIDMPLNCIPPTTTIENFNLKINAAREQTWIDVGFWGGLVPTNLAHLRPLIAMGVRGFKGFLIESGVDEFPAINIEFVMSSMNEVKGFSTLLMFHAEMQPNDFNVLNTSVNDGNKIKDFKLDKSNSSSNGIPQTVIELLSHNKDYSKEIQHYRSLIEHPASVDLKTIIDKQTTTLDNDNYSSSSEITSDKHFKITNQNSCIKHKSLESNDPTFYTTFLASRPDSFETTAIAEIINCSLKNPTIPLHIVHLATHEAIPLIKVAKIRNLPITVETCFHYLSLCAEEIPNCSTHFKCCPPIRTDANRKLLWNALRNNVISTVVSDHSPCTSELKELEKGDFLSAWGGISSIGFGLPILYTEGLKLDPPVTLNEISKWCSQNTAKQAGLSHIKGKIKVGYDADLLLFDPDAEYIVKNDKTYFKNKLTAYDGKKFKGVVVETLVRGNSVYTLEGAHSDKPMGRLILEPRVD